MNDDITSRRLLLGQLGALLLPGTALGNRLPDLRKSPLSINEQANPIDHVTRYNNFYEFGTKKTEPVELAKNFRTDPWTLTVGGAVKKPLKLNLDDIRKLAALEERVYRFRCVEGWSAVIPWVGYPLAEILRRANPTSQARFVAFESYYDPAQMPNAGVSRLDFPYREGLRLDEALHPLALIAVGMYGEFLPPQNGAPVRLVVPWKYGFKSAKSLVKITLTETQPVTSWNLKKPNEYGFYSNVNPTVDHPRWSQATERRLGEFGKRPTLLFNGYAEQVAKLYDALDLRKNF